MSPEYEQLRKEFEEDLASMTDEELMNELRKAGCKFIGDEELESEEQYKESFKHDY